MVQTLSHPTFRRFALYGLILLGLTLSSAVIFVLATDDSLLAREEAFPERVVLDPERQPRFEFPEEIRTYDLEVNRFIDRFARVCMAGQYSEFRLMLSRKRPPILPDRFESNFNALQKIKILQVEKLPPIPHPDAPLYMMHIQYELNDFAAKGGERIRQVQAAILQEDGEYRLGPLPSGAAERLAAYREALENQAAGAGSAQPATSQPLSIAPASNGAVANRPARIGP